MKFPLPLHLLFLVCFSGCQSKQAQYQFFLCGRFLLRADLGVKKGKINLSNKIGTLE
jgi:hypothetical protein